MDEIGSGAEGFGKGDVRRPAVEPVALMRAPGVVVLEETIEVSLELRGVLVPGLPALDAESLVEQRAIHPLDEAVGARRASAGVSMLDVLGGEQELVGMALGLAAEFAAVVGEDGTDRDAQSLVEGQDAVAKQVRRGDRHLRVLGLCDGQGEEDVDDDLDVDLADALERAPVESVLIQQISGPRGLDVATAEVDAVALQKSDLRFVEDEGVVLDVSRSPWKFA